MSVVKIILVVLCALLAIAALLFAHPRPLIALLASHSMDVWFYNPYLQKEKIIALTIDDSPTKMYGNPQPHEGSRSHEGGKHPPTTAGAKPLVQREGVLRGSKSTSSTSGENGGDANHSMENANGEERNTTSRAPGPSSPTSPTRKRFTTEEKILDLLSEYDARATFFILSSRVASGVPGGDSRLQRMLDEGHELGNHGTRDRPAFSLSKDELKRDIEWAKTLGFLFEILKFLNKN